MNRRRFLETTSGAVLVAGMAKSFAAAAAPRKAPFRLIYSNDLTNTTSCISPWHKAREPFRQEMLEASVDEVADHGVDAHFLQPGLGWVPWWPSQVYPAEEHYRWFRETYGLGPDTFGRYVLSGGDVVKVFIERCRMRGQAPFISLRLNDIHQKEFVDAKPGDKLSGSAAMSLTRFYREHPAYRIGPEKRAMQLGQNWAIPEVRAHKLALLRELCENYDLDGLELDFMRFHSLFPQETTTGEQRRSIMTGFVREVRALLDRTAQGGRRRWLCARVPCTLKGLDPLGIDLPAMVEAGLDMVNVSASYFTVQQMDLAAMRKMAPGAALYAEMCHSTWNGEKVTPGYDSFPFRRTTGEQFQTTAHLAYARGADGLSLFNFAYYREHGGPGRGEFGEPPFGVLKSLRDPVGLARLPQHWFLAPGWNNPFVRPPLLPRKIETGKTTTFTLDLAPPTGGWIIGGRLRLQTAKPLGDSRFAVKLNDVVLTPTDSVAELYGNANPTLLGTPETLRAWLVPATLLRDGANQLVVKLEAGAPAEIAFLDMGVS